MTNKEKYKQAFSVLHTSDISEGEVKYMAKLKKQQKMKLAAAAIAVCVIVGGTGTAYAANVGGIRRAFGLLTVYGLISDPAVGGGAWHRPF